MEISLDKIPRITTFPQTRYQGSKLKLLNWIWDKIKFLDFEGVGDLFGGTGAVSYMFKIKNKNIYYNDILKYNYINGLALIENSSCFIEENDYNQIIQSNSMKSDKVERIFKGIYFTDVENRFIDNYIANLNDYYTNEPYKYSALLWCLFQACIIKRPFNLFHRKNLNMRLKDVNRSFGNKTTWERKFETYIQKFMNEFNAAIFDNNKTCKASNGDALKLNNEFDLVYIDTPYIARNGTSVDYRDFYHFLEGLCIYNEWEQHIDYRKKHLPLISQSNPWNSKDLIGDAFRELFEKYRNSHIVVSYRSDGIPGIEQLNKMLKIFKKHVDVNYFGEYKYVLSKNGNSHEVLLIGYD